MKLAKRLLATLLTVVVAATTLVALPVSAEFSDLTQSNDAYQAVDVLSKLGVINGYEEDGVVKFKPENNVTRAEFTAMLLRTRGMGSVGSTSLDNPPFPDVVTPDVSWAIANIRTAREMGIINGYDDGTFKPNNNVSYEEAVKMIVCALGYGEMGTEGAFWYSRYLMTATSLKFLEGSGGAIGAPATRATIAKMLYKCLEVKLAENNKITDKTILENDLNLTKNVGYIDANPEISLTTPDSNIRSNEIQIASKNDQDVYVTETFKVEDPSKYNDLLGAQITYYYTIEKNSGYKVLLMATVKNTDVLEIESEDILNSSATGIEYIYNRDNDRTADVSIASDSVVVYNDRLFGATKALSTFANYHMAMGSSAMPRIGSVKLLDRDGDEVYDVVFINSYEPWVVSSKTTSDSSIVDNVLRKGMSGGQNKIKLDPKTVKFYTSDGKEASFTSISTGDVVCIKQSAANGGTVATTAIICKKAITGKITKTSSKTGLTIGSNDYAVSNYAPWKFVISGAAPDTTAPVIGDSGKFFFDLNGNIVAYDKNESASNLQYGYLVDAALKSVNLDEDELRILVVTKSNVKGSQYTITTKTKINGNTYADLNSYLTALDNANDFHEGNYPVKNEGDRVSDQYAQLVKFSTNGSVVEEIITATTSTNTYSTIPSDELNLYNDLTVEKAVKYDTTKKVFYTTSSKQIYISNALIISVPENRAETTKYRVVSASELEKDTAGSYRIEAFDVTSAYSAKVIVIYKGASNVGKVKADSPVFVITQDPVGEYVDGETRYSISGYEGTSQKTYKLSVDDAKTVAIAPTLQKGDVVRLGKDEAGLYTVKHEIEDGENNQNIIFKMNPANYRSTLLAPSNIIEDNAGGVIDYEVIWGSAYIHAEDAIILTDVVLTGTEDAAYVDQHSCSTRLTESGIAGAKVFKYKMVNGELEITEVDSAENVDAMTGAQYYNGADRPAEVFVYLKNGTIKTIIIVER